MSILLRAELSKICEQFAAQWILDDMENLDSLQFGCRQVTAPGPIVFLALINSALQTTVVFAFLKKKQMQENIQERHKINSNRNSELWKLNLIWENQKREHFIS